MNTNLLQYTAGRVRNTAAGVANTFGAGTPTTAAGLLLLVGVAPTVHFAGVPFEAATLGIAANFGGVPVTFTNGLGVASNGRVAVDTVAPIAAYWDGVPFTANGALAIATPE